MNLLIIALMLPVALAQNAIDAATKLKFKNFFGPSSSPEKMDKSAKILDWLSCKCVPHYLCDVNKYGVHVNNISVTGWGELSIRSGDTGCQESLEICCFIPDVPEPPKNKIKKIKGCGYRNPKGLKNLKFEIAGVTGNEVEFAEFPWVVALMEKSGPYIAAGVLIHPQVVMTAAHIVSKKYPPGKLRARAGEWDMKTIKEILPFQERDVQEIYLHKEFSSSSLKNDIALLKLAKPFKLVDHINVICLPEQDETFDNSKCVASGWREEVFELDRHNCVILKRVELDLVPKPSCSKLLTQYLGNNARLINTFVCGQAQEGNDICQCDGGASLACSIGNDRYKLAGLASWGIACGQDVPGVFANVPMFRKWIEDQLAVWGLDISGSVV